MLHHSLAGLTGHGWSPRMNMNIELRQIQLKGRRNHMLKHIVILVGKDFHFLSPYLVTVYLVTR